MYLFNFIYILKKDRIDNIQLIYGIWILLLQSLIYSIKVNDDEFNL